MSTVESPEVDHAAAYVDDAGALHVPAQVIPTPAHVSPHARALLTAPRVTSTEFEHPIRDRETWNRYISFIEQAMEPRIEMMLAGTADHCSVSTIRIGKVDVHVATPHQIMPGREDWARITVHGGAFVLLGGRYAAAEAAQKAAATGCVTYGVDYRQPPEHPYPIPVDDVLAVYQHLLDIHDSSKISFTGNSAGGPISTGAILKARDQGLPLPGALTLSTPVTDITRSGDTWQTNQHLDNVLGGDLSDTFEVYMGDADPNDPYLSPISADFTAGFPPTLLMSGTRDRLLSDTVLLHRALRQARVDADLHVWEAGPHGNFLMGPEREDQDREELDFLVKHLS